MVLFGGGGGGGAKNADSLLVGKSFTCGSVQTNKPFQSPGGGGVTGHSSHSQRQRGDGADDHGLPGHPARQHRHPSGAGVVLVSLMPLMSCCGGTSSTVVVLLLLLFCSLVSP